MEFIKLKALNEWDSRHIEDRGDGEEKFEGFMIRLVSTFKQLDQVLVAGGFNSENVKRW